MKTEELVKGAVAMIVGGCMSLVTVAAMKHKRKQMQELIHTIEVENEES